MQHALDTFTLFNEEELSRFSRFRSFLESRTGSARGRDKVRAAGQTETAQDQRAAVSAMETPALSFLNETIYKQDVVVDGESFGSVFFRDMRVVLFHMLVTASADSIATEAERTSDAAGLIYSSPATLPNWSRDQQKVDEQVAGITSRIPQGFVRAPQPTLLYLALGSDVTNIETTNPTPYYPVTIGCGNLVSQSLSARHDAIGLWGFLPKPKKCAHEKSAQKKEFSRRALIAQHCALDIFYKELAKLVNGFYFELCPGLVVWFVPRVGVRRGDFPELQKSLCLHATPQSHSPCRYCCIKSKTSTATCVPKSVRKIENLAREDTRPPPKPATMAARAERKRKRENARAYGVTAIGRPPAPLTPVARSVSLDSALFGALEFLHVITGIAKRFSLGALKLIRSTDAAAGASIDERVKLLLPYHGIASTFPTFNAIAVAGKRIEGFKYLDMLLVLAALVEGLAPKDSKLVPRVISAGLALQRLVMSLRQSSISEAGCDRIRKEAVVVVRVMRGFPFMRKTIKLHHLLHYSATIPLWGPPRGIGDTESLEGFMVLIKRLHTQVHGDAREPAMLLRHSLRRAVALVVGAHAVRKGDREPINHSGTFGDALAPTVAGKPELLLVVKSLPRLSDLGGFVTPSIVSDSRTAHVTGGGIIGGRKIRGQGGTLISPEKPWLHALVYEVLFSGGLLQATSKSDNTSAWRTRLMNASKDYRWASAGGADGTPLMLTDFTTKIPILLRPSGLPKILCAARARQHGSLHFRTAGGTRDGVSLHASKASFVSFLSTFSPGDDRRAYNQFSVGRLVGIVSFTALARDLGEKRPTAAGSSPEPKFYAVVELLQHCAAEQNVLWTTFTDMRGLMEPWKRALNHNGSPQFSVVPAGRILRKEHMQFRHNGAAGAMWRFPAGGSRHCLPALNFSRPDSDGDESSPDSDGDESSDESDGDDDVSNQRKQSSDQSDSSGSSTDGDGDDDSQVSFNPDDSSGNDDEDDDNDDDCADADGDDSDASGSNPGPWKRLRKAAAAGQPARS
jgi:hypothetical protein